MRVSVSEVRDPRDYWIDDEPDVLSALLDAGAQVEFSCFSTRPPLVGTVWPEGAGTWGYRCATGFASESRAPIPRWALSVHLDWVLRKYHGTSLDRCRFRKSLRSPHRSDCVYFITDGSGYIKIGRTHGDVASRLCALQTGNPRPLRLIGVTRRYTESDLHERFAQQRAAGEWFSATTDLVEFINSIAEQD